MSVQFQYYPLSGGLDLVTPPLSLHPGKLVTGRNYEPAAVGGYRRIDGFERYDGHPEPSAMSYWVLKFDQGNSAINQDDEAYGLTSGATARVLMDAVVESGSYGGGDAAGYLVLTQMSGSFQEDEAIQTQSATRCYADGHSLERGAVDDLTDAAWRQLAIETARADIGALPGSGPVRGVWRYGGKVYGFRDNAGGSRCLMYVESSAGWQSCDLGQTLSFTAGTAAFQVDQTVTGAVSGATGLIKRVILSSGDWSTGDAVGRLVLWGVSVNFNPSEALTSPTGAATTDGANSENILQPGGRFTFLNHNFLGHSGQVRMYGVDGVSPGFEWDGSVFTPLFTGMAEDAPTRLAVHAKHLFFAFSGGSLQHSGIGEPTSWDLITGAGEIAVGDEISGLLPTVGGVLSVFCRNSSYLLYGSSSADWRLDQLSGEAGAISWTLQDMGQPIFLDDRGLREMASVQKFGDFQIGTISQLIQPWLDQRRDLVTGSLRVRKKNQYRVFYSDNSGLICRFQAGEAPAFVPIDYGMPVRCACSVEDDTGAERLFFGSDDGYVYRLDAGTSFDGGEIVAYIRVPFNHVGTPGNRKRFLKAMLEIDADPAAQIQFTPDFSYGDPELPQARTQSFDVRSGGGYWGESSWCDFYWDNQQVGVAEARIDGVGANFGLSILSKAAYEAPHTIHGVTLQFSMRGMVR